MTPALAADQRSTSMMINMVKIGSNVRAAFVVKFILPPSGKSDRIPLSGRSLLLSEQTLPGHELSKINEASGVTPFVVVPGKNFSYSASHLSVREE